MEQNRRKQAGLAAGCCVLALLLLGSPGDKGEAPQRAQEHRLLETSDTAGEGTACREESRAEEILLLTQQEKELLDCLLQALEAGDYEAAARLMAEEEEQLRSLYYEKMEGKRFLYESGELKEELNGKGLVLKKPGSIYWGELSGGRPEGEGSALQVVDLDGPRYDYSTGTWKCGRMEGMGTVGYHYYEGTGEENSSVRRTGMFHGDLMEGDVAYRTVNSGGQVREWDMKVHAGKLVLDESWIFDEEKNAYQLISQKDQEHAFSVEKDRAKEVRFQNLIPW